MAVLQSTQCMTFMCSRVELLTQQATTVQEEHCLVLFVDALIIHNNCLHATWGHLPGVVALKAGVRSQHLA